MNKTININLGGMFFHIDENAYQKLNAYLNSIRKSLSDDPQGRDEIIKDIEARISELLSEKIVDERQVVSEANIEDIIKIMGQPEDYNVDEELFNETSYAYKRKPTKKLFRDGEDKFLGGVASGTGHYMGIEPVWSRIMWIVFGFATGIGFIAYIILWILLPVANTTAEKLEMEGESVNIDNIEKKIREELSNIGDHVKEGASAISDTISNADYKKYQGKSKSGLQEFLDTVGQIALTILKAFAKLIGAFIIFIAAVTLIGLIIGIFSLGSIEALGIDSRFGLPPELLLDTIFPKWLTMLFGFVAIAIPFIVLFILGLNILSSKVKSTGKVTKLTLLAVWIIAVLGLIFHSIDISSKNSHSGLYNKIEPLNIMPKDTLIVSMVANDDYNDNKRRRHHKLKVVDKNNEDKIYSNNVGLDIRKSDNDHAYIKIRKSAYGKNAKDANFNAEKIEYQFLLDDKNLRLNNYFLSEINTFYRKEIDVIVFLPKGYSIFIDKTSKHYLDDVENVQNIYDKSMVNHYYTMGDTELNCIDCDGTEYVVGNHSEKLDLKIDDSGVKIKIKSDEGDVEMKLDDSGITID